MKTGDEIIPIEVFSGNVMQAEMLKNILEDEGIEAFLNDEYTGFIAPWYTSAGGVGSVKVVVSSLSIEKAKLVVDDFEKHYSH